MTPELMMKEELIVEGQSKRIWKETLAPKYLHEVMGVYHGAWFPDMDRCWRSNDGYQVTSRIIFTEWGKVEHAAIQLIDDNAFLSANGERDIPWAVKQQIKNELFGEKRQAIEVFPKQKNLVDVQDVYHLWVFPKEFDLPFGIHPTRDKQCRVVRRGCPKDVDYLIKNTQEMCGKDSKENTEMAEMTPKMPNSEPFPLPKFLEGEELPAGYYDPPDPYLDPPESKYDLRAMIDYAQKTGKRVIDFTKEEAEEFLIK